MAAEFQIPNHVWLRAETKAYERRTPLTPTGASALITAGFRVSVECMPERIFPDTAYEQAKCNIVPAGTWIDSPPGTLILGLKELPSAPDSLRQTHIYFAHAYKGQKQAEQILGRFRSGRGRLLDLEFLTENNGRRVAAFGYWAGYAGAGTALQVLAARHANRMINPLKPFQKRTELDQALVRAAAELTSHLKRTPRALIIGAQGRSGSGARECLRKAGIDCTLWDIEQTQKGGPFQEVLNYDLLINCVLLSQPTPPFVTVELLTQLQHPLVICDVSCDPSHPFNPLPVYQDHTSFAAPARLIENTMATVISIDNLPTLLPHESSVDFADQLLEHLLALPEWTVPWQNSYQAFQDALRQNNL